MTRLFVVALLALFASLASASETAWTPWLSATITSHHFDREAGFNEHNPGLGLSLEHGDWALAGGYYRNSLDRDSVYVTAGFTPVHLGESLRLGAFAGLATGYDFYLHERRIDPAPIAGGLVTWRSGRFGVNVIVVPTVESVKASGFLGFQVLYAV